MLRKIRNQVARGLRGSARFIAASPQNTKPNQPTGYAQTDPFCECLRQLNFQPRHIVDVGANRGNWTRTAMRAFPLAHFSLFEPQAHLLEGTELESDARVSIFKMGAGPKSSVMKLSKHARDDSFTFALTEEEALALGREQIEAPVVALDEFLLSQGLPYPDLLKIDAEGWDLEVLKGAEKAVHHAEVVLLEAAVMCHEFPNRIDVVISEMAKHGFKVFEFTEFIRPLNPQVLWLVEVAFIREDGALERAFRRCSQPK